MTNYVSAPDIRSGYNYLDISNASSSKGDHQDSITFNDYGCGVVHFSGLAGVTSWSLVGKELTFNTAAGIASQFQFTDISPDATSGSRLVVTTVPYGSDLYLSEGTAASGPANIIPGTVTAAPPATQNVAIHANNTNADMADTSTAYAGPVAGLQHQFINVTTDSLSISAMADNLFIKTGLGNDAVALHGGTNVVDAGRGSNFPTSGDGFDTFFIEARAIVPVASAAGNVPGSIWDTVQQFGHGDAITLWGVSPKTALNWQQDQGAIGHTGLTLHANMPNGFTASLTLAWIDNKSGMSMSYGSTGGASYLYIKAV